MARWIAVAALVMGIESVAWADGVMVAPPSGPVVRGGRAGQMVSSPRQEALLAFDGETVRIALRTHFRAGPKDVAWIVPVPKAPTDVRALKEGLFELLEEHTAPRFRWTEHYGGAKSDGSFGGTLGGDEGDGELTVERAVRVEASGTAGLFNWTVLGATDAAKLVEWLTENDYAVPDGSEPVFKQYVEDGWHWLAIKLRPEDARRPVLAPHPIGYTYSDRRLVYPLVISQLSADTENEIVLYVLSRRRCHAKNWANARVTSDTLRRDPRSPSGTNYEALLAGLTEKHGGRLFMTEYSLNLKYDRDARRLFDQVAFHRVVDEDAPTRCLTRLRAVMKPEAMTRDVVLGTLHTSRPVANVFTLD